MNCALITNEEIAGIQYSFLDDEGVEHRIPLRWHSFIVSDSALSIMAGVDGAVGDVTEVSVLFDHLNRETSVEIVDVHGSTWHMCWDMSHDTRADLYHAVRFLIFLAHDTSTVREWPDGMPTVDCMETL